MAFSAHNHLSATFGNSTSNYEEVRAISLELGGSPDDPKNLWPQSYSANNAHKKNIAASKPKKMICAGQINLTVAQNAIATDWVVAYSKYVGTATGGGTKLEAKLTPNAEYIRSAM